MVAAAVVYGGVSARRATVRSCRNCRTWPASHRPSASCSNNATGARARRRPRPTLVGALGLAYQANMFYEEADRSYAIAEQLGGSAGADPKWVVPTD